MIIRFRLSHAPPSVNRAWRMFRGRMVRSSEFKKWEAASIAEIQKQGQKLPSSCYWRTEIFIPRCQVTGDIDNLAKGIHDALVRAEATPDDRYLVKFTMSFWAGEYVIVNVKMERLDQWQAIMKTSKSIAKRMTKALNFPLAF